MGKKKSKQSYFVELYFSGAKHHIEIKNKPDAELIANCLGGNVTVEMAVVRKRKQRGDFTITQQVHPSANFGTNFP